MSLVNDHLLQCEVSRNKLATGLKEFFQLNVGSVPDFSTLCEAHKAVFRGECIAESSRLKKDKYKHLQSLSADLMTAERQLLCSPTVSKLRKVTSLREQIKLAQLGRAAKSLLWTNKNCMNTLINLIGY